MSAVTDKNVPSIHQKSKPIGIPSAAKKDDDSEYDLKQNFFDPNKSSPPNHWNDRLITRIGNSYEIRRLIMKPEQIM